MNARLAVLVSLLALVSGVFVSTRIPRGERNNNPGNIRHSSAKWQGMSAIQSDPDFVQFDDPVYGIRALAKLLKSYQEKYHLYTVRDIINRYAPPVENDTGAYVAAVAKKLGVDPSATIDVNRHLHTLVNAIIHHENGRVVYAPEQIAKGVSLA